MNNVRPSSLPANMDIDWGSGQPWEINGVTGTIAVSSSASLDLRNTSGQFFFVDSLLGDVRTPSALGNGPARLSYIRGLHSQPVDATYLNTINSFRASWTINSDPSTNIANLFGLIFGTLQAPNFQRFWLPPDAQLKVEVFNDNTATFTGIANVTFRGTRFRVQQRATRR